MLSATAASDEDFSLRFPLHVLVWENDYRKLERELQTVCVRYPQMLMYADSMKLIIVDLTAERCLPLVDVMTYLSCI